MLVMRPHACGRPHMLPCGSVRNAHAHATTGQCAPRVASWPPLPPFSWPLQLSWLSLPSLPLPMHMEAMLPHQPRRTPPDGRTGRQQQHPQRPQQTHRRNKTRERALCVLGIRAAERERDGGGRRVNILNILRCRQLHLPAGTVVACSQWPALLRCKGPRAHAFPHAQITLPFYAI